MGGKVAEDPLSKLFVQDAHSNRETLANLLSPYVRLSQTGEIQFLPSFGKLTNAGKILVFLLAKKALRTAGVSQERESAPPKEISQATGVNYDSVKPTVSLLAKKRVLRKDGESYSVPDHALLTVQEMIAQP